MHNKTFAIEIANEFSATWNERSILFKPVGRLTEHPYVFVAFQECNRELGELVEANLADQFVIPISLKLGQDEDYLSAEYYDKRWKTLLHHSHFVIVIDTPKLTERIERIVEYCRKVFVPHLLASEVKDRHEPEQY